MDLYHSSVRLVGQRSSSPRSRTPPISTLLTLLTYLSHRSSASSSASLQSFLTTNPECSLSLTHPFSSQQVHIGQGLPALPFRLFLGMFCPPHSPHQMGPSTNNPFIAKRRGSVFLERADTLLRIYSTVQANQASDLCNTYTQSLAKEAHPSIPVIGPTTLTTP